MENKPSQPGQDEKERNAAQEEQHDSQTQQILNTEEMAEDSAEEAAAQKENAPAEAAAAPVPAGKAPGSKGSKAWIAVSAILAIALVIVLVKPPFGGVSAAVATVNGVKISKDKLYDELVAGGGASTLNNMITSELINQAAEKAGVTVTEQDVDAEIESLKAQFGGEDQLNSALQQYGMSLDDLRKDAETQVKVRKILEPQTKVTDDDIKKYYDENKASFATPEQVRASHILVATKQEADEIKKELDGGADFAELAKTKSTDTGSAVNGGDLGFFGKGDMVEAFEKEAFSMEVNEISEPIKSDYGYHIIKKTDYKAAANPTLEEKKEEIRKTLVDQQVNELSANWMADLRAQAKITNTLDPSQDSDGSGTPASSAPASGDSAATPAPGSSDAPAGGDAAATASPDGSAK